MSPFSNAALNNSEIYLHLRSVVNGTNVAALRLKAIIPTFKIHKLLGYYWDGVTISMVNDLGKRRNLLIN